MPCGKNISFQPSHMITLGKYQQQLIVASTGYFLTANDSASVFLVCVLMKELLFDRSVAKGCNNDKLDLHLQ